MGILPWPRWITACLLLNKDSACVAASAWIRFSKHWFDLSAISRHRANRGTTAISSLFTAGQNPTDLPAIPPFDRILPGPSTPRQSAPSWRPRRPPSSGHPAGLQISNPLRSWIRFLSHMANHRHGPLVQRRNRGKAARAWIHEVVSRWLCMSAADIN